MKEKENIIKNKINQLNQELSDSGKLSSEKLLNEIKQIQELAAIESTLQPQKKQYPIVVLFVLTLVIITILLFFGPRETQVSMEVKSKSITFYIDEEYLHLKPILLKKVKLRKVDKMQVIDGSGIIEDANLLQKLELSVMDENSVISLDLNKLKKRTKLNISNIGDMKYKLVLTGDEIELLLGVKGKLGGYIGSKKKKVYTYNSSTSIDLSSKKGKVVVLFTLLNKINTPIAQTSVADISFSQKLKRRYGERIVEKQISSVNSGSIYLDQIKGKEIKIRQGVGVLSSSSAGVARAIHVFENSLLLEYVGSVTELKLKRGNVAENIMPSYLELISMNSQLALLWGSTLYIFGLWLAVRRWWIS